MALQMAGQAIPAPSFPPKAVIQSDGLIRLKGTGTPRRHSRRQAGIQRNEAATLKLSLHTNRGRWLGF